MVRRVTVVLVALGSLAAAAGAWTVYQRQTTDEVPYTVVARVGDVELRRYPSTVVVETVAPNENVAFRRLYRYITGANEGETAVEMTAPVEVTRGGTPIPMTAPVEVGIYPAAPTTDADEVGAAAADVRMAFFLPTAYDIDTAPTPTDPTLELRAVPERTLAVRRFSWVPSDRRIQREAARLLAGLESADVAVATEPFFLGYDAPWTLPFLRRNEVAVEVAASD
ncbi:SOUL family heme-binding protein [Salinigranum halophilum]|jgi:hypothetical protein|uniref:SOUL family heme-binding protein n=1 Tax=Salinigranum halophilum TaxID=2565931 RepID=UPI0010A85664|nr:heme-binding protein [Salinigranum halophilum]